MQKNYEGVYDFVIKSYESDFNKNMSLSAFFLFLQECAWENAKQNGFGYEFVEEEGALWVLSKVKIEMKQYPKWKEEIKIRTWPRGSEGLFALRDYQLFLDGKVIGAVASHWLVLDKESKRPRRISDFKFAQFDFIQEKALDTGVKKIDIGKNAQSIDRRKVYASDLDMNGHVNNATYVKWVMDAHAPFQARAIECFEINFVGELFINDSFDISHFELENRHQYILKNLNTGKAVCYVELH